MSKKIAFVNGSLRKASFNQSIVDYLKSELTGKGFEVSQIDFSQLPLLNQDIEFPAPAAVAAVREEMISADALWIVTPEYNGSVPGGLKNMLDWVSRPVEMGTHGAPAFVAGKLVAISGAAGAPKAALVRPELTGLVTRMGMAPLAQQTGLTLPGEAFQTGVFDLSEENKAELNVQVEAFVAELAK